MKRKKILKTVIVTSLFIQPIITEIVKAQDTPEIKQNIVLSENQKVPELKDLKSVKGRRFNLNKALLEKPSILIFYRGSWCPYCNAHFAKIKTIEKELINLGFQIIAISPDKPEHLKETLEKYKMNYLLLSDSKMEVAKSFGIDFKVDQDTANKYKLFGIDLEKASGEKHGLLPVPSVFIIDKKGIIKFKYSNPDYKVRLEPDVLLQKAKEIIMEK